MAKIIYIEILHHNYWWGIYNLTNLTDWEDVVLYEKIGEKYNKVGVTTICSKSYFLNSIEELKTDESEKELLNDMEHFIQENKTTYYYYYDDKNDNDFYEVPFEAKRNINGIKPRKIEIWYPEDGINKSVLDSALREYCSKFLKMEVEKIQYKEELTLDEATEEYDKFIEYVAKN